MGEKLIDYCISVIIPAYNAERTIVRALESVRNQTVSEYICEVIIINDGSTDGTEVLIEQYINDHDTFPVKLFNKKNGGVASARNEGLLHAKGNWIAFLDSDDEWIIDKIEKQLAILSNYPNIDFLGGNHTDQIIKIFGRKIDFLYKPTVKELCIKMFPQTSTVLFRKKIYDEIGGFDVNRRYAEDGQFFLKICEKYNYYYIPEKLIIFDGGRRGFGVSGLSGNLRGMHDGELKNFKELRLRKSIGLLFYVWICIFSQLKYVRRVIICKLEKI